MKEVKYKIFRISNSENNDNIYLISCFLFDRERKSGYGYSNSRIMVFTKDGYPGFSQKNKWVKLSLESDVEFTAEKVEKVFTDWNKEIIENEVNKEIEGDRIDIQLAEMNEEEIVEFKVNYHEVLKRVIQEADDRFKIDDEFRKLLI
ncbi:hypothetical protein [Leptospira yasudae]|uniref:hypothetical protein n=1 Tax=Leptospira yasudae TaxID=2202201 RepID=UPI001090EFA5|nr:hypothetical protein [Leptospira yasudae]TGM99678.1 hypothetical protein EHR10_08790 [Leptospira yasudae]